jgi:hypothetical protein
VSLTCNFVCARFLLVLASLLSSNADVFRHNQVVKQVTPRCVCRQHKRVLHYGWSALLEDLQQLVLTKLSPFDLTRASRTCKQFHGVVPRVLAGEHHARCNLAAECFGSERITCISRFVHSMFQGESLEPYFVADSTPARLWISEDATPSEVGPSPYCCHEVVKEAVVQVRVDANPGTTPHLLAMDVLAQNGAELHLRVERAQCVYISVSIRKDADLEGVALVQALLRGGISGLLRNPEQCIHILVQGASKSSGVTPAGLKAQIAPLLLYGPHCKPFFAWKGQKERVHITHGAAKASKGVS